MKKAFETEEDNGENDKVLKQFIADSSSDDDEIELPQDAGVGIDPYYLIQIETFRNFLEAFYYLGKIDSYFENVKSKFYEFLGCYC